MKELSGRELLKLMAQQAKNRMKGNYEQPSNENKNFKVIIGGKKLEYKTTIITNENDEILYSKVSHLLQSEGDVYNALDRLIDTPIFNKLTSTAKEKYLLDLSEKYCLFKERFYSENNFKESC